MESFNAELNAWLDRVHPTTREYVEQSLRNGSQTPDRLFGAGHELVERLQLRIREGITRYIASMKEDDKHPLLSRRTRAFDSEQAWFGAIPAMIRMVMMASATVTAVSPLRSPITITFMVLANLFPQRRNGIPSRTRPNAPPASGDRWSRIGNSP